MTQKIYYEDAYIRTFSATVTDCRERKKGYEIVLNRTAFYPEGGGQPGDNGTLELPDGKKIEVTDTHEHGEEILHYTDEKIEVGTVVAGTVDWAKRFDLMQNHSGEHIVSGLINRRFGYNNVGFHMGKDMITIDLDGEFTAEEMREIEKQANEIVWADSEVQIRVYTEEEVKAVEYRSKKELHGMVRIVTFPGADVCACCGTHVKRTGEIGLIKLISLQKFKGGMRMEMLCGRQAMEYISAICMQNTKISVALSAKPLETSEAVARMKNTLAETSFHAVALENRIFETTAEQYRGAGDVVLFEENLSADGVRKLASLLVEICGGRCIVYSGDDEQGYKYVIAEKDGDVREFVKEFNKVLNGRGGGKPFFAQGSVAAKKAAIEAFLA